MTAEQLKDIFENTYNQQQWITVLREIFGIKTVHIKPQAVDTSSNRWDAKGFELGNFETLEGRLVGVYEVQISESVKLERNKVGLRNLLKPIYDTDVDAALIVFNQGSKWRFSYVSQISVRNKETNRREKKATDPKRYTYIFGKGQKCRTAADRFTKIQQQYNLLGGAVKLEDIEKAFSVDALTKDFYRELSDWYFRALKEVKFPDDAERAVHPKLQKEELEKEEKTRNATSTIRLITRIIFVWFLKQKGLVPDELFDKKEIDSIINYKDKTGSTYYKAILQNLFFATLNTEMGDENRKFIERQYGVQTFYRYKRFFKNTGRFLELTRDIPFLNGGLFENLDKNIEDTEEDNKIRIDCFSNAVKNEGRLTVPDSLFFNEETVDLSTDYGDKKKKSQKVRGLINILQSYNFTIEENTPFEIEIALDPELLGKVFENLLASYNPETETTARKMTGSFYTPREIVDYMVDESLKAYLSNMLPGLPEEKLNQLFSYRSEMPELEEEEKEKLVQALDKATILDPACGSGAFPMGVLHKMVWLLTKLDPQNDNWKAIQRKKAIEETEEAFKLGNKEDRDERLKNISEAFEDNSDDYGRKLYLIENCIYGVDIQPIAVQIAKLRFFISLICDQEVNEKKKNRGVRPLPNLETKFVAANTLIGLNKPKQLLLRNPKIEELETELRVVRHKHFSARTSATKRKWRNRDHELREQVGKLLKYDGWDNTTAEQIANWNPYDQNSTADFFDNEWMFGIIEGFDTVIGNPPYLRVQGLGKNEKKYYSAKYISATGAYDLYVLFTERGFNLLNNEGILHFIEPDKWVNGALGKGLRKLIGRHIKRLISFKEYQVFNATTYSSLIMLSKRPQSSFEYYELDRDLPNESSLQLWLKDLAPHLASIYKNDGLNQDAWTFTRNEARVIIEKLNKQTRNVKEIFERVFTGLQTSLDDVYFLFNCKNENGYIIGKSKTLNSIVTIEEGLMKPILKGEHVHRYKKLKTDVYVLLPYHINRKEDSENAVPMKPEYIQSNFPKGWNYLNKNKELINERENGKIAESTDWYRYLYPKNLTLFEKPKLFCPDICARSEFAFDFEGKYYATTTLYGYLKSPETEEDYRFFLGVLNSSILWYFMKNVSVVLANGYYRYMPRYIENFPIPSTIEKYHNILVGLVECVLTLKRHEKDSVFYEQLINSIVYELYFSEEVKSANCEILEHLNDFPDIINLVNDELKLKIIDIQYKTLSHKDHPVRIAMFNMDTIEEIAIIEGKKK
ncbi:MAG: TaqI-like C-terminal specificity domain-containing protein [Chitinophagaceae bacterium]